MDTMADYMPCAHCRGTGLVPLDDDERELREAERQADLELRRAFVVQTRLAAKELGGDALA